MKAAKPPEYFDAVYFDRASHIDEPRKSNYGHYTKDTADFAGRADWVCQLQSLVNDPRGQCHVLDVGCAKGFLVEALRLRGVTADGVDLSEYAIAKGRLAGISNLHLGSATALPFPDQSFDLVVSWDVLEHLDEEQAQQAVAESARVARHAFYHYVNTGEDPNTHFPGDESHTDPHPQAWWDDLFAHYGTPVSIVGKTVYRIPA
jgi:SAM-dependent methyltransferase